MSQRKPSPEKRVICIASAGLNFARATQHRFIAARRVRIAGETGWEFIYRCEETGVERRYGWEDLLPATN